MKSGLAGALALASAGCMGLGGDGPDTSATASVATTEGEQVDIRRYIGPDYCPEIRIRQGTEVMRRYEAGYEDQQAHVLWQASIGKTARECLYDQLGNLTLRVGVSGRVVAGPKGASATVALPLRIAVVKYKEAVLASELYPLNVTIPPNGPFVFSEVREVTVPSPGTDRDYILFIGLDEKGEGLLDATQKPVVAAKPVVKKPAPRAPAPVQQAAPAPAPAAGQPNMLPTPSDGFVLPR